MFTRTHLLSLLLTAILCKQTLVLAQTDSTTTEVKRPSLKVDGYVEAYYCYDLSKPADHVRSPFLYNHNRHNEVNVNLAFIHTSYADEKVRGNVALMVGNYAQYNLAAEDPLCRHVYEANAGVRLVKGLWLDAGVFASHIGFESAISKDCKTLTRSLVAENSPYYESGAKLSYTPNSKWLFSVLYLNGWQRIQRINGHNSPCFGSQITYKPNDNFTINYSNFLGNPYVDTSARFRHYHNLYGIFNFSKHIEAIAGFDIGMEQSSKGSADYNTWYTPVGILRAKFNKQFAIAFRGEYFKDNKGVLITTNTPNGYDVISYSLNTDYSPTQNVMLRLEGRIFQSKDKIFRTGNMLSNQNAFFTASAAISF